jgi:hypothetical protein
MDADCSEQGKSVLRSRRKRRPNPLCALVGVPRDFTYDFGPIIQQVKGTVLWSPAA